CTPRRRCSSGCFGRAERRRFRSVSERVDTKRPYLTTGWERLSGPARVQGVDLARGLAVLGMFTAHLLTLPPFDFGDPSTWAAVAGGRSWILFATLAGVSIGLVTGGSSPLTGEALTTARLRLIVRACLLWLLGI